MMKTKKVAIITGAAGGIGRATALAFASAGFRLCMVDRNSLDMEALAATIQQQYNEESLVFQHDLSDSNCWSEIVEELFRIWGRIDVLVNNAADRSIETMRTISLKTWADTLNVCLGAPAFLSKYCAEKMEQSGSGGVIINISSVMSDRPGGTSPAYIAAKGAMESLTRELSVTYGRSGIRVLSVKPGYIDTDLSRDYENEQKQNISQELSDEMLQLTPLGRSGTPGEIAEAILWLSSEKAAFITGASLVIDGGFENNLNSYRLKQIQFPKEF